MDMFVFTVAFVYLTAVIVLVDDVIYYSVTKDELGNDVKTPTIGPIIMCMAISAILSFVVVLALMLVYPTL